MKLLLDTHVLLWWLNLSKQLSNAARELVANPENVIFVSAASIWEVRIKESLGKVSVPNNFTETLTEESFEKLPITFQHADAVRELKSHHRDPFDRMLIAQAVVEGLTLVSHDRIIAKYNIDHILV